MATSGVFVVESTTSDKFVVGDSYSLTFAEGPIFISSVTPLEAGTPEDVPEVPADEAPTTFEAPTTESDTTPTTVSEAQPPVGFVSSTPLTSSPTEPDSEDSTAPSDTPAS